MVAMADITRRGFLKLLGAAVTISAGGIALIETHKTFFLPPVGGWVRPGSWELECARSALDAIESRFNFPMLEQQLGEVRADYVRRQGEFDMWMLRSREERMQLLAEKDFTPPYAPDFGRLTHMENTVMRRERLLQRVDKLARGWTGYSAKYHTLPNGETLVIHGGRS
jgi:hypothetical protein